ncbi:MAG: DUF4437 domain-containing protein [Chthoniobacterales bacterium]
MKKLTIFVGLAIAMVAGIVALVAQGEKGAKSDKLIYAMADQMTFKEGPLGGVSMATVWGDPQTGAHGQFTKMKPGWDAGMHTHSNTLELLVIKGAYLYRDEAGDKRVGPGGFIRIPAGHKHWSGSDKTEGALFYEDSDGKFDLTPAQQPDV